MTGKTHLTAGIATALLIGADMPQFLLITFGSLLPDIDHQGSTLGKKAKILSKHLKHRGLTHSLIFTAIVSIFLPYLGVGILTHIILDMLNPQGVKLLYPNKKSFKVPFFSRFAKTGGGFEHFLFGVMIVVILVSLIFYQDIWGYTNFFKFSTLWYDLPNLELPTINLQNIFQFD